MQLKQQRQLIQAGIVTEAQISEAELRARNGKKSLLQALLEVDAVDAGRVMQALERIYNTPYVDITHYELPDALLALCPENLCTEYGFVPLSQNGHDIEIATDNPLDVDMLNVLGFKLGKRIVARFTRPDLIRHKIREFYRDVDDEYDVVIEGKPDGSNEPPDLEELKRGAEDSPIIKLVNRIVLQAMQLGSSDIHIEPGERESVVRLRIDGRLRPMQKFKVRAHPLVVSRIKIISRLDIANTRTPQDGRTRVKLQGKCFDIRVSTLPAMHGEKVVMRILDKGGMSLNLDVLCFEDTAYKRLRECICQPTGAILVTGPTGSGKTTTLYSILNHIRNDEMNMITIEDPIEFQIEGVSQVQVNAKAGMTFAAALRSILRQDPDVVMVGEIRDEETAEIALHAAQTGHLVFSTLHTNDAASTITRLIDIGIEPAMLASSLNLVVAQRLVRRLCVHCRREITPEPELIDRLGIPAGTIFFGKVGCDACMQIGYKGRMSIHEVLYVDDRMRKLFASGAMDREILQQAREQGMFTMFEDGLSKVLAGQTSLDEVMRVCKPPEGYRLSEHLDAQMQLLSLGQMQQHAEL